MHTVMSNENRLGSVRYSDIAEMHLVLRYKIAGETCSVGHTRSMSYVRKYANQARNFCIRVVVHTLRSDESENLASLSPGWLFRPLLFDLQHAQRMVCVLAPEIGLCM